MGDERKRRRDESLEPHASCDEPFDPDTFDWEVSAHGTPAAARSLTLVVGTTAENSPRVIASSQNADRPAPTIPPQARYEALSRVFHTHRDAYPRGCPEERELRDFVPKAARFNARLRAASSVARSGVDDADATRATNGGGDGPPNLPRRYDPRYKVNAAVLTAPRPELERAARRERLPAAAVDEYRRVLAHYEDFRQRRSLAKLVKLAKDKSKLPIAAEMDAIVRSVREHPVTLIAGDTGCGKSTQVPQYLLRAGFDRVACTQPRRVAATALARRVSHETLNEWGGEIAYKIRFDTTSDGARTRVLFMTEGVLLRQLRADPDLREFDVVVIDEAHERHLNTDLALGLLKRLTERRREFRLVIMSATIDLEMFARYFGGCPAISVPGRLHPIKLTYLDASGASAGGRRGDRADEKPQVVGSNPSSMMSSHGRRGFRNRDTGERFERIDPHPYLVLLQRIDAKYPRNQRGDLLVFLPGMAEIGAVAEHVRPYAAESKRWIVLPLHSALSAEEQDKVFDAAPEGVRKCVLSTNVAETSVTIDGVRFVCDSGRHKEMQHDPRSGAGSLQEGWISRASADQRKGRAGRTGPGVCFRLYSEAEYARFQKNTPPEISRANLQGLVLQLKGIAGGSCDPRTFPWLEPPPRDALESATWSLREHGALTSAETLTPLGSLLASLPVDVNAGKLLVLASLFGLTGPATSLAAALAVKSPFARKPGGSAGGGREARFDFESPHGDPFTALTAYARWLDVRDARRENSRKWCRRMGLEEQRLVEMAKLQRQFSDACEGSGLTRKGGGGGDDDDGGDGGDRRGDRGGGVERGRRSVLRHKRRLLRDMQRARERERGRRVLAPDGDGGAGGSDPDSDDDENDRAVKGPTTGFEDELRALDLAVHVDLRAARRAARGGALGRGETSLMKAILAQALYPRVAAPDSNNASRERESDWRFHSREVRDAVLHPTSTLCAPDHAPAPTEVVLFGEMLETHRVFLCNCARAPAHALLLSASNVECDVYAERILVDRWLMLRVSTAGGGESLLVAASRLRLATRALLRDRLRVSKGGRRRSSHGGHSSDGQRRGGGVRSDEDVFEEADAPPADLLAAVRAAPVPEAARLIAEETVAACGGGVGGGDRDPSRASRSPWGEHGVRGDDLADDLAKFIEWPVRYDVDVVSKSALLRNLPPEPEPMDSVGDGARQTNEAPDASSFVGIAVAPWLRWAGLREKEDDLADHAAAPHLRKRWKCPACGVTMMAFYQEIDRHRERCGLPEEERDPAALPANFGKGGGSGPSLQEELAGGANLGLPREALSLRPPATTSKSVDTPKPRDDPGGHVNLFDGASVESGGDTPSGPTRSFACEKCGKTLELTTVGILKHRRSCRG